MSVYMGPPVRIAPPLGGALAPSRPFRGEHVSDDDGGCRCSCFSETVLLRDKR